MDLNNIRKEYTKGELLERDMPISPFEAFDIWMKAATADPGITEPTAMVISTVSQELRPSSRVVLLKEYDDKHLVFYTHYTSRKGREMIFNPNISALLYWPSLERQLRIEGMATKISRKQSTAYFNSRPYESKLSAMLSKQSQVLENKEKLILSFNRAVNDNIRLMCPPNWGGYKLKPDYFEFWQGGSHRLHDRIVYRLSGKKWIMERLYP